MFGDPIPNPRGWPVLRFDSFCDSRLGKMLDARQQTGEHRRPYLRNANVYWDRLDLSNVLGMDFDESDRDEFRLQKGDLLVCEGGEVGRCAIWNDELHECYFQKALHRVRPIQGIAAPEYVLYLLWALAKRGGLHEASSKVTFAHLTGVKLKALRVPLPPVSLQEQFSRRARPMKQIGGGVLTARERLESLFRGLLARAFNGDLTASWRAAHMNELLQEMEHQAKALAAPARGD